MEVTDEQYDSIRKEIMYFKRNKKKYKFNVVGLFAVYFNIKIQKENTYYCAEFVKKIVNDANLGFDLPELVRPEHFKCVEEKGKVIYEGLLREYKVKKICTNA